MKVTTLVHSQNTLGESPFWHAARQSVFWVDIEKGVLHEAWLSSGQFKKWSIGRHISLIVSGIGDELILAAEGGILRFDPDLEKATDMMQINSGLPNQRCNDGNCDSKGRLWVGVMDKQCKDGYGSLYRIDRSLHATKMLDGLTIPNGLVWSADNTRMFFIDTLTRKVKAYQFDSESGSLQFERNVISIPEEMGLPDGMTIDSKGMLWIALYGGAAISKWNPENGVLLETIKIPALNVTNCIFVGNELDQLIVTSARENMTSAQLEQYPQSGNVFHIEKTGASGCKPFSFLPLLMLFFLLFPGNVLKAQEVSKPFVLGAVKEIQSVKLGEKRTINIYVPDDYDTSHVRYPIIYLLDGSANEDFIHIVGLVQFLTMIEAMPKSIVVGIANIDRRRDFTYPTTVEKDKKDYPTTGSSAKFISFIEAELQPFVEKIYRASTQKTIIGQSLGGLLATEILLKKSNLFTNYIIVSPSLWWDNESLLTLLKDNKNLQAMKDKQVYISVGTEGKIMEADATALHEGLKSAIGTANKLIFNPLPKESHLTILHQTVYQALLALYAKGN
ncbi:MAG: SMP-30/gluconolactonase/LRE family protein [Bacteroidota bacterium]